MATLIGAFDSWSAWWSYVSLKLSRQEERASWADQYRVLKAYATNNGCYEVLNALFAGLGAERHDMRPLRNPAFRVVEFYAAKLWPGPLPGALPIVTDNPALPPALEQVWTWSNWGSEKQAAARWFATYGDMFLKVATKTNAMGAVNRVHLQNIEPIYVSDFDADERGYLTYVRFDIPRRRRVDDKAEDYTHTEVWTKADYRLWEHTKAITTPIAQLGPARQTAPLASFGIDFIPVVWQPFRNIGDERGAGAFTSVLDKIDEANRQATRLHQMLFRYNRALWAASANGMDAQGRPLPPPNLGDGSNTLTVDDDTVLRLPGNSTLTSLVAPIDYAGALAILDAQLEEIQRDLPELAWYDLRGQDVSGVAAGILLGDAIDRASEARGNAEAALARADMMALTIGQNLGLFPALGGTYADGALDHTFAPRPVLEPSETEKATTAGLWVQAGMALTTAMRRAGASDEELAQMAADKAAEGAAQQATLAAAMVSAQRSFDQNVDSGSEEGDMGDMEPVGVALAARRNGAGVSA